MDASRIAPRAVVPFFHGLFPVCLLLAPAVADAQETLDDLARQSLNSIYSVNVLLTSGDAVRFGFWDFNVSDYFDVNLEGFGDAESAQTRESLSVASFPYDWEFPFRDTRDRILLGVGVSYLAQEQDLELVDNPEDRADKIQDSVLTLSGRAGLRHRVTDDVALTVGSGLHWMRYRNDTDFRTDASRQFRSALDGIITNIEVDALVVEPAVNLTYQRLIRGTDWQFFTDYHYLYGSTVDPGRGAHDTDPEAWYWTNGVRVLNPVFSRVLPGQNIWFRVSRVDVGGDMGDVLGNDHYYETGLAWLVNMADWLPLVDNVAIGVNFNIGSSLRGGSLYLTFNED